MRGIGRAAAVRLAELGAHVVVTGTGRDPKTFPDDEQKVNWKDIESTAEQIRAPGVKALTLVVDVTDQTQVENMIRDTISKFGRVDILINNAAAPIGADRVPIIEVEPDVFQRVIYIKIRGTYLCTQEFLKANLKQNTGGKIVNISSTAGKRGVPNTFAYNAANFAIVGMTQSAAKELGPNNINVNCVCPGATETARMDELQKRGQMDEIAEQTPIGRNGTDEEVGHLVAHLCTEATSWITGQSININGGTVVEH
ncbi:MAG: 3-oxoacyl-[acyl-carrier-protein] reductase FabG [Chloroflexota bacterium]|nr:MAG: 3-oxoacyl-[acyl-carrier-protein] reductase FabG [Chloroflexota bacterium]